LWVSLVGECSEGSYWDDDLDKCELCPKGTYQDQIYRDTCAPCTPGYTTQGTGSTLDSDCYGK